MRKQMFSLKRYFQTQAKKKADKLLHREAKRKAKLELKHDHSHHDHDTLDNVEIEE